MEHFLLQLFIFLAAATIAVPLAKKAGLGSVLGYLLAGILIGPYGFSLMDKVEEVMHFTEFGVVMMLFLVGLELQPSMLWKMRAGILGMGGAQVVFSAVVLTLFALYILPWQQALSVGLILSLSSTAIVLQTLQEKGLDHTSAGRSIFSVLLFQDLAVIPMIAALPLLATSKVVGHGDSHHGALFDISSLPVGWRVAVTAFAILLILIVGKYGSKPMFRAIAASRVREVFVAAALALVIGISVLMYAVGLSPALGAFLGGVVLADSEYRHELESNIEPFKGLLLGVFFISVGASLNFQLISQNLLMILGIVFVLIASKYLVLYLIGSFFNMSGGDRTLFAFALAQGGEFAFVLFQVCKSNGVMSSQQIDPIISAVAISMFLAPILFMVQEKISCDSASVTDADREADRIEYRGRKVIIAGFGRLGTDIGRFLISAGIKPVILDNDASNVDVIRKFGYEVYYGDVTRLDLLEAAGAAESEILVIAIRDLETSRELIELAHKHFPKLKIVSCAANRRAAYELMDLGVNSLRRETFGSALSLGQDTLQLLGLGPYEAYRLTRIFRKKDQEMMYELYKMHKESEEGYVSLYQQQSAILEELMQMDCDSDLEKVEKAWVAKSPEI